MRICVDASPLLLRSAGVKNYLYHWIQALQRVARHHTVSAYPFIGGLGDLTHEGSVMNFLQTAPRIAWLLAANKWEFARRLATGDAQVFHVSNQVHDGVRGKALTATVHDMTCWLTPEFHTPGNIIADKRFAERVLSKADGLIAVSEKTREDAIQILGLKPEKIVAIHSGVPPAYFEVTAAAAERVRRSLSLDKPFILHIGTIEPRKNLDALLDAYLLLPDTIRRGVDLVFAGPIGWAAASTAQRIQSGLPGVRYLGYVPESDVPGLTKAAAVFAYPSLYEGFGFPAAQAMAAGVPVLTSNNSCLPEITGAGAIHVDPRSVEALRDGLERLLVSSETAAAVASAGREKANEYRWERCAERSWRFFEQFA
ncbi:MAG TPA: glycosyltransferase family 1 protein [Bryobacteraceae bacterium]|nr:glycosyltransferase family 1 protein [Bryobacteraceae bacterium]